jgi:hypothetical protein
MINFKNLENLKKSLKEFIFFKDFYYFTNSTTFAKTFGFEIARFDKTFLFNFTFFKYIAFINLE